jgi:hypothetical protein
MSTAYSKYANLESHKAHTESKQCISIKTTHCVILILNNQINPKTNFKAHMCQELLHETKFDLCHVGKRGRG